MLAVFPVEKVAIKNRMIRKNVTLGAAAQAKEHIKLTDPPTSTIQRRPNLKRNSTINNCAIKIEDPQVEV